MDGVILKRGLSIRLRKGKPENRLWANPCSRHIFLLTLDFSDSFDHRYELRFAEDRYVRLSAPFKIWNTNQSPIPYNLSMISVPPHIYASEQSHSITQHSKAQDHIFANETSIKSGKKKKKKKKKKGISQAPKTHTHQPITPQTPHRHILTTPGVPPNPIAIYWPPHHLYKTKTLSTLSPTPPTSPPTHPSFLPSTMRYSSYDLHHSKYWLNQNHDPPQN